jgi:hypothetical protein
MSKRVVLITDNDDPYNGLMSHVSPAQRKIRASFDSLFGSTAAADSLTQQDFKDAQYELQHIFIHPKPDVAFDLEKLYGVSCFSPPANVVAHLLVPRRSS